MTDGGAGSRAAGGVQTGGSDDVGEPVLPARADVVVVGGGLTGTAAAWAAARSGLDVVLLEQFDLGHALGSSHGSARIVRRAYPDPFYVRLTGRAFAAWEELEAETEQLLRLTGGIDHGSSRDVDAIAAAFTDQGVPHELLPGAEAERRWPGTVFDGPVLFHPQAGTIDADASVLAAARAARRRGAVIAPRTPVTSVRPAGDGAVVVTPGGHVACRRVVVAAGAWIADVLRGADLTSPDLEVTQQQIFHFARRPGVAEWPTVVHKRAELSTYSLPGGRDGGPHGARKVAEHLARVPGSGPTTAATRSGIVDELGRRRVVDYVHQWFPGLDPVPFAEATCLYTTTPDEDFVLDRVGPVVVASPCSGHGAKFAPLLGQMIVDLATGAAGAEPRFALDRWGRTDHRPAEPARV